MPNHFIQGTTHVTYVKSKGKRRDRRYCIYYNGNGSCGTASSCTGSSQCSMYITQEEYDKKKRREAEMERTKAAKLRKEEKLKKQRAMKLKKR